MIMKYSLSFLIMFYLFVSIIASTVNPGESNDEGSSSTYSLQLDEGSIDELWRKFNQKLDEETVNELECRFNLKKDTNDHITLGELIEIINSFDQLEIDEDDVQFYVKTLEYKKENYDFEIILKILFEEKLITEQSQEIINLFSRFSKDGIIDVRIVGNLAKSTKRKFSRTLKIKIKKALENNNGKLKFSDFANLMHALYTMINK
ncbi:uncharacterized protein LOC126899893 isoform X4 [Daktulosphaira vitifoliae]|uniref:uncharacterized protein LOC126899893 isoform X4 n=1 Tax=Daktulosphaira vitifoliae TaxID=58002 RepID=UPI0021AADC2E|nr:uncharacterized protein LOC126899893 isoform X4 [Daktulosphaira vitifoliae]